MSTKAKFALVTAAALTAPAQAFAHAGDHSHLSLATAAEHLTHSPIHMAAVAAGAVILGAILWKAAVKR